MEIPSSNDHGNVYGKIVTTIGRVVTILKRKRLQRRILVSLIILLALSSLKFCQSCSTILQNILLSSQVTRCATEDFTFETSQLHPLVHSDLPEIAGSRRLDVIDTFLYHKHRNNSACNISSLDLHTPFAPLCESRADFLAAFSGGGRIGFDSPFMPRGCDMRWFSTEEACEIFSRFERVVIVGDSMMRHVVGAINVLLRRDLGYGAVTNWNFDEEELNNCFCNHQMDVKSCSVQGIFTTSSVLSNDPSSFACHSSSPPIDIVIEMMLRYPLDPTELTRFENLLSQTKPSRPYAFIFGHGLWNDLDLSATLNWLDGILEHAVSRAPYLDQRNTIFPRLFISPNAAGILKPDQWLVSQGDKALQIFENSIRVETGKRGVEALGTWNMSIQASKYDGVHMDLKGNLIKAMGVLNWLAMLDVNQW